MKYDQSNFADHDLFWWYYTSYPLTMTYDMTAMEFSFIEIIVTPNLYVRWWKLRPSSDTYRERWPNATSNFSKWSYKMKFYFKYPCNRVVLGTTVTCKSTNKCSVMQLKKLYFKKIFPYPRVITTCKYFIMLHGANLWNMWIG